MDETDPPLFKYKRLTKLPPRFFNKDPVSACLITSKIFIFATHSGMVLIATPNYETIKLFKAHTASVLSLDFDGEYFTTCSMDGTVIVGRIQETSTGTTINESEMTKYNFKRPIYAVAINESYSKTKSFICGGTGGSVINCSKNWFNQRNDTILDENGGCVTMIKYKNDLIIWANNKGITFFQSSISKEVFHIPVPESISRPELYWPKVEFTEDNRILIGWVSNIWQLSVNNLNTTDSVLDIGLISYEVLDDCLIGGVSTFKDDLMILNCIPKDEDEEFIPPELNIMDIKTYDEISVDELLLKDYRGLGLNDYHLMKLNDVKWILVSANDAIIVEVFSLDDKIEWYCLKEEYLDAWKLSEGHFSDYERLKLGEKQVEKDFQSQNFDKAFNFLKEILKIDNSSDTEFTQLLVEKWNYWLEKLQSKSLLLKYCDILPSTSFLFIEDQISHKYYYSILYELLDTKEYESFTKYFDKWDHSLFDLNELQSRISDILSLKENADSERIIDLRKTYIMISLELDEPDKCVSEMIKLQDTKLLEFMDEHHLIEQYFSFLPEIVLSGLGDWNDNESGFDMEQLITNIHILVENSHEIVPERVLKIFKENKMEKVNYLYLMELRKEDGILVKDYEDEMVFLIAKFNKNELLNFLKRHIKYSIDKAIKICEEYECIEELVYLMSKIGENKNALILIIDKLKDPKKAITFVQKINDKKLWDFLLDYSQGKSEFIKELLSNVGSLIDPIPVVSRIPKGVEIENLRQVMLTISQNVILDKRILEIVMEIISSENLNKNFEFKDKRLKGYVIKDKELETIREDINCTYLKTVKSGKFEKEEEALGEKWSGDCTNKIAHKSFIKYKLNSK